MVVINLYGVLESYAQRTIKVYVESFDEAMSALFANFPGLRRKIREMRLTVLVDGQSMMFEDCLRPLTTARIDILPVVGGTGPAIPIVVGAILSYVGPMLATYVGVTIATAIANFGVALIIGGISQLLFKPPKPQSSERATTTPSYMFNGAVNTVSQGGCVPVGFGRMRVGSQVISVNVQTYSVPIDGSGGGGSAPNTPTPLPPLNTLQRNSLGIQMP